MKTSLQVLFQDAILYFIESPIFIRRKKTEPSLLAINIDWFTNCSWVEQLIAFKQIDEYYAYKH